MVTTSTGIILLLLFLVSAIQLNRCVMLSYFYDICLNTIQIWKVLIVLCSANAYF
jgi:hypothetical protein